MISFSFFSVSFSSFFSIFLLLSLFSPHFISSQLSSQCYTPSAASIPIFMTMLPGPIFCPPGYYCPNLIPTDNRTWPIYCSPSMECAAQRGRGEYCDPQGYYEITVCPKGYYCPQLNNNDYLLNYNYSNNNNNNNNYDNSINPLYKKYKCPEDYYCPLGSTAPKKCTSISDCPEGSYHQRDYTPLLVLFIIDGTIFVAMILFEKYNKKNKLERKKILLENNKSGKINNYSSEEESAEKENNNNNNNNDISIVIPSSSSSPIPHGMFSSDTLSSIAKIFLKSQIAANQSSGLNIQFNDYSLRLPASGQQKEKILLQGVTGEVKSGSVTAIMGPSGCGKTTFLSTLMGKIDSSWPRSGNLIINNDSSLSLSDYQQYIGYTPQDDVIRRDLTVYENLYYCTLIRLPPPPILSEQERLNHINNVMQVMGLLEYRDSIIGTEEDGGALSLEVRKRINIALELCAAPLSIFLDEPTTGMDSYWALQLTRLLKSLARIAQSSVVMIIHQPRAEIWESLDNVLLLAPGGLTVYQGPQSLAVKYFSTHPSLLIKFELHENPADILMDRIAEMGIKMATLWKEGGKKYLEKLIKDGENNNNDNKKKNNKMIIDDEVKEEKVSADLQNNHLNVNNNDNNHNNNNSATTISKESVKVIDNYLHAEAERRAIELKNQWELDEKSNAAIRTSLLSSLNNNNNTDNNNNNNNKSLPHRGASFFQQIYLSTIRAFIQQLYSIPTLLWECSVGIILGIIFGVGMRKEYAGVLKGALILLSPTGSEFAPLQTGMFLAWLTGLPSAVPAIALFVGNEQTMYWREAASGHSKLAYYIGVNISAIPRIVLGAFHCAVLFFLTTAPQYSFGELYLLLLMAYFAVYGVASFLVMLINRNNATLVTVVFNIITGIMNGYVQIIPFIVQWLCYSRWLTEAVFTLMSKPYEHLMQIEEQSIPNWKYKYDVYYRNLWILFIVGMGYRALGYIFMVNRYKEKQR